MDCTKRCYMYSDDAAAIIHRRHEQSNPRASTGAPTRSAVVAAQRSLLPAWGDNAHSANGPGGQNHGVPEGVSVGCTGS